MITICDRDWRTPGNTYWYFRRDTTMEVSLMNSRNESHSAADFVERVRANQSVDSRLW